MPPFVVLRFDSPLPDRAALASELAPLSGARRADGRYCLAVRSSGVYEDAFAGSAAGSYTSVLGTFELADVIDAVQRVRSSGEQMSVILQELIEPDVAGVGFSLDPTSYTKGVLAISWVAGRADALVSGVHQGDSAVVHPSDPPPSAWSGSQQDFKILRDTIVKLESHFGFPVDVEWLFADGELSIVQVRPVVLPPSIVLPLTSKYLSGLPHFVRDHPKIALRRTASDLGVKMSRASVVIMSGSDPQPLQDPRRLEGDTLGEIEGMSIVLLHPSSVGEKVIREFAPVNMTNVEFWTEGCRRYAIRRYPTFHDVPATALDVLSRGLKSSWVAAAIVQEIHGPVATGIMRATDEGFLLEIAMGHFVPKGMVTTSTFILSRDYSVTHSQRHHQATAYHFLNGYVLTESPVAHPLALSDDDISNVACQLTPLFSRYPTGALEFGVISDEKGVTAFLIDAAEADIDLPPGLLAGDVVSPGRALGQIVPVQGATGESDELDAHLLERFGSDDPIAETIFLAERASVDLLPLVYRADRDTAFVFKHASLLSHLPVVMRERGVPGVVVPPDVYSSLLPGSRVEIDALSVGLAASERVRQA